MPAANRKYQRYYRRHFPVADQRPAYRAAEASANKWLTHGSVTPKSAARQSPAVRPEARLNHLLSRIAGFHQYGNGQCLSDQRHIVMGNSVIAVRLHQPNTNRHQP